MQTIYKLDIGSDNNEELTSKWLCLAGNEVLSADHSNQRQNTTDDCKTCYLLEYGFPNEL